jgi:GDP/UDP-N,N'-diacetylbacillosamine 2-epimerase (hydrolysing)
MPKRKICVVTGTRADYGLLRYLMEEIRDSEKLKLQVIATGMHLSPEYGLTYREIESDGFEISRKIETLLSSDTPVGVAKATGLGVIGFADAFDQLQPEILVVLGDRFEILAAATAALFARIPIAHIHGGETTEGAFDEGIRHAITKMSHFHFVAAEEYRNRVIQLGENPGNVFQVGGFGVDGIVRTPLMERQELEQSLDFKLGKRTLLITFHPVTLEPATAGTQFDALLEALNSLDDDIHFVFTLPNADTNGRSLISKTHEFVKLNANRARCFTSLGQVRYWSLLQLTNAVVGNSSSGLLEAPTLNTATVDIGDRQTGRLTCDSVIRCDPNQVAIRDAIQRALTPEFQYRCQNVVNPYGSGGATEKTVKQLEIADLTQDLLKKKFYDLGEQVYDTSKLAPSRSTFPFVDS